MLNENFVFVGLAINLIGMASYLIDTIKGKIRPNKVSFALWSLAPFVAFFAQVNQGVGMQSILPLSVGLIPMVIFAASFVNKKAYWQITTFDVICGVLSILGLILWYITKVGNIAIFFSILADGLAYLPTIKKAYQYPETESAWPWGATTAYAAITLLTIKNWDFATSAFAIYYVIINFIVFFFAQFKIKRLRLA